MPDDLTPPTIPERCAPPRDLLPFRGIHTCYPAPGGDRVNWYTLHPGQVPPGAPPSHGNRDPRVTTGFGVGMLLLPYLNDYGLRPRPMTRRAVYPTIWHSFPRAIDRTYALHTVTTWTAPNDSYAPPFILFLLTAPPFAGWRWHVEAAKKWLTFAEATADRFGPAGSLTATAAATAAAAWIDAVRGLWRLLTIETFPYDPPTLASYWTQPLDLADLSSAPPLPTNL